MIPIRLKIFLSVLVFMAFLAIIFVFLSLPILNQVKSYYSNILLQKATIKILKDQIATLENFKSNYDFYNLQFNLIGNGFVNPGLPIDFIEYIEKTATSNNLDAKIPSIGMAKVDEKDKNALQVINLQINSEGLLSDCFRFLEVLENGPWFLEIKQANLDKIIPSQTEASTLKGTYISLSLNINAFAMSTSSENEF